MIIKMSESISSDDNHKSAITMDSHNATSNQFEGLQNLKRKMEYRNSELGKTWSELSRIMYQYQSELVQKHEQLDLSLAPGERARVVHLESVIENSKNKVTKLEKRVADLEYKLLEKDSEIVRLRTEVHQLQNEVTLKDNLIQKIQDQMASEAMEYQNEIVTLKDLLQVDSITNLVAESQTLGAKRRKTGKINRTSPQSFSDDSSYLKIEQTEPPQTHNPPVFPSPQAIRHNGQAMDNERDERLATTSLSEQNDEHVPTIDGVSESDADPTSSAENRLLIDDVYGTGGQKTQNVTTPCGSDGSFLQQMLPQSDVSRFKGIIHTGAPSAGQMTESPQAGDSPYKRHRMCRQCNKLILAANYARHKRQHMGIHPFYCTICKRTFSLMANGIRHVQMVHHMMSDAKNFILRRLGHVLNDSLCTSSACSFPSALYSPSTAGFPQSFQSPTHNSPFTIKIPLMGSGGPSIPPQPTHLTTRVTNVLPQRSDSDDRLFGLLQCTPSTSDY